MAGRRGDFGPGELHFAHTAGRLGLTSSRVSQVLRDLETKLGAQLFHRTSRRVRLTALGERLRDEVSGSYRELDATLERIEAASRDGSEVVRVRTFSGQAAGPHFLQILRTCRARHPNRMVDMPAAAVPLGGAGDSLPGSIQLSVRSSADDALIALLREIEHELVTPTSTPPSCSKRAARTGWAMPHQAHLA